MKKLTFLLTAILLTSMTLFAQIKFVCIGNSITHGSTHPYDGKPTNGIFTGTSIGDSLQEMSYRFWFWEKVDSAGINATMVGYHTKYFDQWGTSIVSHSRYTAHTFVNNHEAYYGITTDGFVNGGWNGDGLNCPNFLARMAGYTPDVALIHIGTNDDDVYPLKSEDNIKTIISTLRVKNPIITILLARLTTDTKAISKQMPRIATETTTNNSIVYCVDQFTGFISGPVPGTMTLGYVHPNAKGQKFMAQNFYNAYMKVTKADAVAPTIPTGLAVSNVKATAVDLAWTATTDNTGVNVYNIYANDVLVASTGTLKITVTGLTINTAYVFKITAVDYQKNESGKSTGVNTTTPMGYDYTLIVNDGTSLLQNAEVTVATVKKLTDVAGKAVYPDQTTGSNAYQIVKKGYKTASGTMNLTKDTIVTYTLLPDCSILFTLTDGTKKMQGAKVVINTTTLTADANGQVTFSNFKPGTYSYSITYKAYKTATANITFSDDTTVNVSLLPDCSITFTTMNGTSPLPNVMINFNGANKKTDALGKAIFTDMRPGTYTYTAVIAGYNTNTKGVTITDDTTFTLAMINPLSSPEEGSGISIYPNPAENIINIANAEGSSFEIIDIGGILMSKGIIASSMLAVDISKLPVGSYLVKIIKGQLIVTRNFTISR